MVTVIRRTLFRQKHGAGNPIKSVRVTLSSNINVNSNNSLQAEAFTLIIFEYVTVCFIRLYLLLPQNNFFQCVFPKMMPYRKKKIHSCCRELGMCTLESLKGKVLLYFIFSLKVKMFFPLRLDRQQSALITVGVSNQARAACKPIMALDWQEQTWNVHKQGRRASSPKCSPNCTYSNLMKMDLQSLRA